ncbi:MAG: alpha/beta hydrolase [Spirosomataceae bacterium]
MKTLVLVHGHGVDADIWKKLKVFLHDFDVLTPDFSTQTAFKTIEEYADGLFHWLEHQKIEKARS